MHLSFFKKKKQAIITNRKNTWKSNDRYNRHNLISKVVINEISGLIQEDYQYIDYLRHTICNMPQLGPFGGDFRHFQTLNGNFYCL